MAIFYIWPNFEKKGQNLRLNPKYSHQKFRTLDIQYTFPYGIVALGRMALSISIAVMWRVAYPDGSDPDPDPIPIRPLRNNRIWPNKNMIRFRLKLNSLVFSLKYSKVPGSRYRNPGPVVKQCKYVRYWPLYWHYRAWILIRFFNWYRNKVRLFDRDWIRVLNK